VLEVLVVETVLELQLKPDLVVLLLLLQDMVLMEHGVPALHLVEEEPKLEDVRVLEVLVVDHVLDLLLRHVLVVLQLLLQDMVHMDHGADALCLVAWEQ